jgi:hypothetical protein
MKKYLLLFIILFVTGCNSKIESICDISEKGNIDCTLTNNSNLPILNKCFNLVLKQRNNESSLIGQNLICSGDLLPGESSEIKIQNNFLETPEDYCLGVFTCCL